jgi:hypothetical protein
MIRPSRLVMTSMLCAAAVTAQFIGGKATRDALLLTSLHVSALPIILIATSASSILLVAAYARAARRIGPATLVPASFGVSGVLFVCEWFFRAEAPEAAAVVIYLHVSGAGPLLASGFWLIATERFDPSAAKKHFGEIAGAGTLGGIAGALLSERVAAALGVPSMLLFLAAFQFLAAWLVWRLAVEHGATALPARIQPAARRGRPGLRVIAKSPHLQQLATVVVLGTTSAALLDYLFQVRVVEALGPGDRLLRFFALYYGSISVVSFALQMLASRAVLERFGLALTTSAPSIALLAGSIGGLLAPGLGSLVVARGSESIFRASWFRAGYELFYTPIPAADKRAAKSLIDVAFDRLGDALGGGLVRLVVLLAPAAAGSSFILVLAMVSSAGAILAASRLNRWYLRSLESSLVNRAAEIDLARTEDGLTANALRTVWGQKTAAQGLDALVRVLLDPAQDEAVRQRAARALSKLGSQRAVDGLLLVLEDPRFGVRFQAARSLAALLEKDAALSIDPQRVYDVVGREIASGRPVWEGRRLLEPFDGDVVTGERALNDFVRDRAGRSLSHVFTLLSLVLPGEPLRIAYRSLRSEDRHLRGTALAYLDGVLPPAIRERLLPFLEDELPRRRAQRGEIIADLLRADPSVTLRNLAAGWEKRQIAGFEAA